MSNDKEVTLVITLQGGLIQHIEKSDSDVKVTVQVWDYDHQEEENAPYFDIRRNADGDLYEYSVWEL